MFGVLPAAQSIVDLIDIAQNYPGLAEEFEKNIGTRYRRHRRVREFDTESTTVQSVVPYPMIDVSQPQGILSKRINTHTKVWVDSAWSPRPSWLALESWLRGMPDWTRHLGVTPNAANLWELVPYSWLVDYFTNAGTVLSNLSYSGVAGMGMDYAYCMAETSTTTHWSWVGPYFGSEIRTSCTKYVRTKQRIRATPFGFGLKPEDLTPSQLAILAALGISRWSLNRH